MKLYSKLIICGLFFSALAYPNYLDPPIDVKYGGTGSTTATGSGSVVLQTSPTVNSGTYSTSTMTGVTSFPGSSSIDGSGDGVFGGTLAVTGTSIFTGAFQSGGTSTTQALAFGQIVADSIISSVRYGSNASFFGYRSSGTEASPTTIGNNQNIARFGAGGYDGTSWNVGTTYGSMDIESDQAWTNTAHGTKVRFITTPNGSVTPAEVGRFTNAGNFLIGNITGTNLISAGSTSQFTVDASGDVTAAGTVAATGQVQASGGVGIGSKVLISQTAPTYTSGFSTGTPTIVANGTTAFTVTIGSTPSSTGILAMPTASNGWVCMCTDTTTFNATVDACKQIASGSSTAAVELGNFTDLGVAGNWVASDVLVVSCYGY